MKLIVGLGNPGKEYQKTRHNVGFMVLDTYAKHLQAPEWQETKKWQSLTSQVGETFLAKPQSFMNDSGRAVQALAHFYKLDDWSKLWVVHDDLDLALGSYKIQLGTGPKVHNGLGSIYEALGGSQDFWHVRVGIDSRNGDRTVPGQAYVLQQFTAEELTALEDVIAQVVVELKVRTT